MILSHTEYLLSQKSPNFFCVSVPFEKMVFVFAFIVVWKLFMLLCIVGILGVEKTLFLEEIVG